MGELLAARRNETNLRLAEMQKRLAAAEKLVSGKACVYATGSFGRGEASRFSDLDLFIVGGSEQIGGRRLLSRLDEICVKADLVEVTRDLKIPEFSGDGEYLEHYTVGELIRALGTPEDDSSNAFTARLLLLLESQPLVGAESYRALTSEVIAAYWRDYENHRNEFMPAYLANDILRLWRTFCVNYEARTSSDPPPKKAKRKLKNYKLKHSRLLTCYSALLYLLAVYSRNKTVHPEDAVAMIQMTPTQRLEWLMTQECLSEARETVAAVIERYEQFLRQTEMPEEDLVKQFMERDTARKFMASAPAFGDLVYSLLSRLGGNGRFFRLLVV